MIDTNKKYLAIVSISIVLGMGLIPSLGAAQANLSITESDIQFYDLDGNQINSVVIGESIVIKITLHNNGNEASEPTDIEVWVNHGSEISGPLLYLFKNVVVPADGVKELTIVWDTSKNIGNSVYPVEKGLNSLMITYYPTDESIKETSANSGFVLSSGMEFKEKSTEDNSLSGIISILLIIGGVFLLLFIILVVVAHKKNAGKNIRKKKGDDWI